MKHADPIRALTHRHLDGAATPEDMSELALALLENPEAARTFAEITRLDAGLATHFRTEKGAAAVRSVLQPPAARRFVTPRWMAAAAAVAALASGLAWWRPWAGKTVMVVDFGADTPTERPRLATLPPSEARRRAVAAGTALTSEAAAFQRFATRYWLPDPLDFQGTSVSAAIAAIREQAEKMNHLKNPLVAGLKVDFSDDIGIRSVTASRRDLPLRAWLEILAAEAGCLLQWNAEGVAFVPLDDPDELETRRFRLPDGPEATGNDGKKLATASAADPFNSEPQFTTSSWQTGRFAAWVKADPLPNTRFVLRDAHTLEVRHTRRTLRRMEARLAVLDADARRPEVAYRAKELPVAAASSITPPQATNQGHYWNFQPTARYIVPQGLFFASGTGEPAEAADPGHASDKYTDPAGTPPASATWTDYRFLRSGAHGTPGGWKVVVAGLAGAPAAAPRNSRVIGTSEIAALFPTQNVQVITFDDAAVNLVDGQGNPAAAAQVDRDADGAVAMDLILSNRNASSFVAATEGGGEGRFGRTWEKVRDAGLPADPLADAPTVTASLGTEASLALPSDPALANDYLVTEGASAPVVGYDFILPAQPTPQLTVKSRLEGEMIRLTGTFRPAHFAKLPTDFDVWLKQDQSFVLQTEDPTSQVPVLGKLPVLGALFERPSLDPLVLSTDVNGRLGKGVDRPAAEDGAVASPDQPEEVTVLGEQPNTAQDQALRSYFIAPDRSLHLPTGAAPAAPKAPQQIVISPQVQWGPELRFIY